MNATQTQPEPIKTFICGCREDEPCFDHKLKDSECETTGSLVGFVLMKIRST